MKYTICLNFEDRTREIDESDLEGFIKRCKEKETIYNIQCWNEEGAVKMFEWDGENGKMD